MKRFALAVVAALPINQAITANHARAQETDLSETAVALAPEDAAFFSTSVNLTESYQDFMESSLVTRLKAVPYVQRVIASGMEQWENAETQEIQQVKGALSNPTVKDVLTLAKDMFNDEVFVYGGGDWCEMIDGFVAFQNEISSVAGQGPEAIEAYFSSLTQEDIAKLKIPTTVLGFRLGDDELARLQLDALEAIVRFGLGQIDEVKPIVDAMKRVDYDDGQSLSLVLDTSLIPMDQIPEGNQDIVEKVIELLEGRSISLSLGVKDKILLVAFSEGTGVVGSFGENETSLLDQVAFKELVSNTPDNLRTVSYVSEEFREAQWTASFENYFQKIAGQFTVALDSSGLDEAALAEWKADIEADAKWLDEKLYESVPKFGPALSYSYGTEDGAAGYGYDWNGVVGMKNAAALSILDHAGSNPLMAFAFQTEDVPAVRQFLEFALAEAKPHVERFIAIAEDGEEDREAALAIVEKVWPIAEEFYSITKEKIAPALKDNQSLIAVSGQWTLSELGPNGPVPPQPLPILEVAGACSITDRDLFLNGCAELYDLFDRCVELARELDPDSVPAGYAVPRPDEEALQNGTRYYYGALSDSVPLEGFEPQLVVTDDAIVFGYSFRQVDDMLEAKSFSEAVTMLVPDMEVAARGFIDIEAMFNTFRPWVEFGLATSGRGMDQPLVDAPSDAPVPTGNDVLQIWDSFQAMGQVQSYMTLDDDGPTVVHWEWQEK